MARARLGARGGARGAAPDPRAAAARERALGAARSLPLPPPPRRQRRLLVAADGARPAHEPQARAARCAGAAGRRVGDARRRAAEAASEAEAPAHGICASRTRRACATASRRSKKRRGRSSGCSGSGEMAVCVVVPGEREGSRRAFFVAKGQVVCARPVHRAAAVSNGRPGSRPSHGPSRRSRPRRPTISAIVASFIRRPPPELEVLALGTLGTWSSCVSARWVKAGGSSSSTASTATPVDAPARPGGEGRRRRRAPRRCRASEWPATARRAARRRAQRAPARARRRPARAADEEGQPGSSRRGKPSSTQPADTRARPRATASRCPPTIRCSVRRRSPATRSGRCSTTSSCSGRCRSGSARAIRVVDAGCGKAYMSLALVAYGRESWARASSSSGSTATRR